MNSMGWGYDAAAGLWRRISVNEDGKLNVISVPEEHGADKHTNITREIFLPVAEGMIEAGTLAMVGKIPRVWGAANVNEPLVNVSLRVPLDFVSFTKVEVLWSLWGTGDLYWQMGATWGEVGENPYSIADSPGLGVSVITATRDMYLIEPASPLTLSGLATGDFLGLMAFRVGGDALDTIDAVCDLLGFVFTYVANQ